MQPEGVDVHQVVHVRVAERQFGRHERGRAGQRIGRGELQVGWPPRHGLLDESEVQDLDEVHLHPGAAGVQVRGLDVAMHQVPLMGLRQREAGLPEEVHHPFGWQGAVLA